MVGLVGRDDASAAIEDLLDRLLQGRGGLLVVSGSSGTGRSAVLAAACDRARARGARVIELAAAPLDRESGLGLVRRLLRPLVDADPDLLVGGTAAWAAPVFAASSGEVDRLAVSQGLITVLGRTAEERGPLVLAADDVDLADADSLRVLLELAHAAKELPVLLVLSTRDGSRSGVAQLQAAGRHVSIGVLGPAEVEQLAAAALAEAASPEVVAALVAVSGGLPAIVIPVLEELASAASGGAPTDADAVAGAAPHALPAHVAARLDQVSPTARELALASAVLPADSRVEVAAAAAAIDPGAIAGAVAELVDAGLVRSGPGLVWSAPILRRAARELVSPGRRGIVAIGAARAMSEAGDPPEQIASLLVDAPTVGEVWAVGALAEAASLAERRGAPEVAKELWLRQLEEPMDLFSRGWATAAIARAEMHLGDPAGAERLRGLAPLVEDHGLRARVEFAAGRAFLWNADARSSAACFAAAAEHASGVDDQIERRSQAGALLACGIGLLDDATMDEARGRVGALDGSAGSSSLRAALALVDLGRGAPIEEVLAGARAAVADDRLYTLPTSDFTALTAAALCLVAGGAADEALLVVDRVIAAGHQLGQLATVATVEAARAGALVAMGRVSDGVDRAEVALSSASAWPIERPAAAAALAEARRLQGDLELAEAALAEAPVLDPAGPLRTAQVQWLVAAGRIALDRGDAEVARGHALAARTVGPLAGSLGADDLLVQATAACGSPDDARDLARSVLAAPGHLRPAVRGLLAARCARLAADLDEVVAAAEVVRSSGTGVELVEALVLAGDELVRHGKRARARDAFREALALADEMGTKGQAAAALDGLRLAGGRPRRRALVGLAALTPAEERICRLVAAGCSNREVADALFLSRKTVEYHLGNAYSKLAITRREELADAIAPPDGSAPIRP
jgi:DNA-binding CsgD family transcriptional regulator